MGVDVGLVEGAFLAAVALAGAALGFGGRYWLGFEPRAAGIRAKRARVLAAVVTAGLMVAVVWRFGATMDALAYAFFIAVGVQLSIIDLKHRILPNRIVLPAAGIGFVLLSLGALTSGNGDGLIRAALGAVALFAAYLLLAIVSPSGLGMGDVKLALVVGMFLAYLGWTALFLGTLAAFVIASVVALLLIAARRANRHSAIPFGPFMVAGAVLMVMTGQALTGLVLPSL